MPNLYPALTLPLPIERRAQTQQGPTFAPAPLWNFLLGDFVRDSSGHCVITDGYTAWTQWVFKVCLVSQHQAKVYDGTFGQRIERLFGETNRAVIQSEIQRTLTAALLRDPRTAAVQGFSFVWPELNTVQVTFTAIPAVGTLLQVQAQYTAD